MLEGVSVCLSWRELRDVRIYEGGLRSMESNNPNKTVVLDGNILRCFQHAHTHFEEHRTKVA